MTGDHPRTKYQRFEYDPKKKRNTFTPEELEQLPYIDKNINRLAREGGYYEVAHPEATTKTERQQRRREVVKKCRDAHRDVYNAKKREAYAKRKAAKGGTEPA